MKYPEARKLFEKSWTIPHGWHYCSFHKDVELDAEPCPEAMANREVNHLAVMKWQPADRRAFQRLLEEATERLHLQLLKSEATSTEARQLMKLAPASPV